MNIKEYLKSRKIVCDGAFGTYYAELCREAGMEAMLPELATWKHPELVKQIHREYIEAGAVMVRTNTFASNMQSLACNAEELQENIRSGMKLVREAAAECGREIFAAGDIGPGASGPEEYRLICETFLEEGADCLLFETFSEYDSVLDVIRELKKKGDPFIIVQFSVNQHGFTNAGISARRLMEELGKVPQIDAAGFNCGVGPGHLAQILNGITFPADKYLTALPNASYPKIQQDRMVFLENQDYFAQKLSDIADMGIDLIGGCCGTTPVYIRKLSEGLDYTRRERRSKALHMKNSAAARKRNSSFYAGKKAEEKLIAVELAPPFHADDEKILEASHYLREHFADTVTFPDSPSGRTRADSIMTSIKAAQMTGICAMPHICCRDKNAIAIRAQLLGAYMNGIRNMLIITGDPVPSLMRKDIKSVYNFDSIGMMKILQEMNQEEFAEDPITYGGALNHNRSNLDVEIGRMKKKSEAGAGFFLTQPLFTRREAERLREFRQHTDAKILCGLMPLVSRKNALFIRNEMTGIQVTEEIVNRYVEGMSRAEGEQTGVGIVREIMGMTADFVDGYYFSIPFNRVYLLEEIWKNEK